MPHLSLNSLLTKRNDFKNSDVLGFILLVTLCALFGAAVGMTGCTHPAPAQAQLDPVAHGESRDALIDPDGLREPGARLVTRRESCHLLSH